MATQDLIDPRAYERLIQFLDEHELRPRFATKLAGINIAEPTVFDAQLWQRLTADVNAFITFHQEYPFVVAPAGTLDKQPFVTPLRQQADGQQLTLSHAEVTEHAGMFGRSGSGKTNCDQQFAIEAYRQGLSVVTIDGKDDARYFPIMYPDTIIIDKNTRIPLLEPPSWVSPGEARSLLITPLKHTMWGGEGLQQVATESHQHTFAQHPQPSVADWRDEVRKLAKKGDTYTRRDRCEGLAQRLDRLIDQYPGLGTTRSGAGIPLELLCTRPVYFGFGLHTEIEDFLTAWLLELRFSYNRARDLRALNTFLLLDESNLLVHDKTINEEAPLAAIFPLLREFGISVGITANNYRSVPPPIRSSLYLQVAMNLTDANEATDIGRTFGLTAAQREYLDKKLTRGTCIVKLGDRWKHPILATFDQLLINKKVEPAAWETAVQRTNALARPHPVLTLAAREGMNEQQPALPASPRQSPAAGQREIPPNKSHDRIALNTNDERLLRFIAERKVVLTTECDGHPQIIARSKKRLLTLGLIQEERITARAGRGGQGNALGLTKAGYEWLSMTPGGAGRGGLQHQYLVTRIARGITHSHVEFTLRDKRIDLVFALREEHRDFLNATIKASTKFTNEPLKLHENASVAIEVEATDPVKTAPVNAAKNAAVHIELTIIATLPKDIEKTIVALKQLTPEVREQTILIDALTLLRLTQIAPNGARP